MKHYRGVILFLIGLLAVAACGGPPPRQVPTPEETDAARQDSVGQAQEKKEPASAPKKEKTTGVGEDALKLFIKGEESDFADYYANIIAQIDRYFHWTGTSRPSAEVYFVINRDGSVADIRLVRGSGNAAFDVEAISAIEQAGQRHAFGPLPKGMAGDRLPVRFEFKPAR